MCAWASATAMGLLTMRADSRKRCSVARRSSTSAMVRMSGLGSDLVDPECVTVSISPRRVGDECDSGPEHPDAVFVAVDVLTERERESVHDGTSFFLRPYLPSVL